MVDLNYNSANKIPSVIPTNIVDVFKESDLGTEAAGVVTIPAGFYEIKAPITTANRWAITSGDSVTITTDDRDNSKITSSNSGSFLTTTGSTALNLQNIDFTLSDNAASFLNYNSTGLFECNMLFVTWTGSTPTGSIGTVTTSTGTSMLRFRFNNYHDGITYTTPAFVQINDGAFFGKGTSTGAAINVVGPTFAVAANTDSVTTGASESVIFLDPEMGINGSANLDRVNLIGAGTYYKSGDTGTFSATSDEGATNTIPAVTDGSPNAVFDKQSALTNLQNGDIVVHTNFDAEATYQGTFTVANITANTYEAVNAFGATVAFTATDDGTSTSSLTRFTSTAHAQLEGQSLLVTNSIDYNGAFTIRGTPLTNSFDLRVLFTNTQTGNWDTGSLDQSFPSINQSNSIGSAISMITGELHVINIATPIVVTIVTQDVAVTVGTTTWTSQNLERISATTSGVATFDGITEADILVNFSGLIEKVGGGPVDVGIGLLKNGSPISGFIYAHSVNTGIIQISGTRTINMIPSDTLEIAVINFNGTSNINVSQADMVLSRAP